MHSWPKDEDQVPGCEIEVQGETLVAAQAHCACRGCVGMEDGGDIRCSHIPGGCSHHDIIWIRKE